MGLACNINSSIPNLLQYDKIQTTSTSLPEAWKAPKIALLCSIVQVLHYKSIARHQTPSMLPKACCNPKTSLIKTSKLSPPGQQTSVNVAWIPHFLPTKGRTLRQDNYRLFDSSVRDFDPASP